MIINLRKYRKFILTVVIILILIGGYLRFILLPLRRKTVSLSKKIEKVQKELSQREKLDKLRKEFSQQILKGETQLQRFDKMFLRTESPSQVIKILSSLAEDFQIEIITLSPLEVYACEDERKRPLLIEGKYCGKMPFRLELLSRYKNLGEYLDRLLSSSDLIFSIEDLKILRDEEIKPRLRVRLVVSSYILLDKKIPKKTITPSR